MFLLRFKNSVADKHDTCFFKKMGWVFFIALFSALFCTWPAQTQSVGKPSEDSTEILINRLSSKETKVRENATELLIQRKGTTAALQQALQSPNREIAQRVAGILKVRALQQGPKTLERLKTVTKSGAVDQVAEILATWPTGFEEAACWNEVCKFVTNLLVFHHKEGSNTKPLFLRVKGTKLVARSEERVTDFPQLGEIMIFIRASEVNLKKPIVSHAVVVACSGNCRTPIFYGGAIFATGSVVIDRLEGHTIIVSDGDVKVGTGVSSLIIARGNVICDGSLADCHIICGGRIILTERRRLLKCTLTEYERSDGRGMEVGSLNLFDLRDTGIYVEDAVGGVRVKGVKAGSPFKKAGLQKGDLIITVDGWQVQDVESFRKWLRRSLVVNDGLTLRILRDGNRQEIRLETPW